MMNSTSPSLADIAAVAKDNDGFGGNNGWWILIILFAIFGGWGNGWNGNNTTPVLGEMITNADLQRGFDIQDINSTLNTIGTNVNTLGTTISTQFAQAELSRANAQAATMAQMSNNALSMEQGFNGITQAINNASCSNHQMLSDVRYDNAANTTAITNAITLAAQQIMQNDNANYRSLHDEQVAIQMEAKNEKIADLQSQVSALNLAASQCAQNATLVNALRPTANPAYIVANPYTGNYYSTGCLGCSVS